MRFKFNFCSLTMQQQIRHTSSATESLTSYINVSHNAIASDSTTPYINMATSENQVRTAL